jgi:glyoxylase-like metal-dependent hydrolase (beta-lactamase superfamily II)
MFLTKKRGCWLLIILLSSVFLSDCIGEVDRKMRDRNMREIMMHEVVNEEGGGVGKGALFTLWQLPPQTRSQMNSYVIMTAANELVVIDGGTHGDAAYLREFIRSRGNHVHAWLISHTHYDHVGALTEILNTPEHIRIDKIYGTFPDDEWMKIHQNANAHRTQLELKEAMEKARQPLLELSPGQTIRFGDITFTILSSINPELTMNAVNNQSVTWRVDGGAKSVLFLGDLGEEGGDKLMHGPYGDRLSADYVQMAHHGQEGVKEAFYQAVNPRFCLWPTPGWLWENDKGDGPNSGRWRTLEVRAWMEKLSIEKHYIAKDGLQRIEIPVER